MSEIPFVNRLGDALETAIAPSRRPVRRWRRPVVYAAIGALALAGTAAATGILSSERTTDGLTCYTSVPTSNETAVFVPDDLRPPAAACAEALRAEGRPVPELVACDHDGGVAVVPGRGAAACGRAGLEPLPAGYERKRARRAELERALLRLEAGAGCLPPGELAERVRSLLQSGGFDGWSVRIHGGEGPCGSVSNMGGAQRSAELDPHGPVVIVSRGFARSVEDALLGPAGLLPRLDRESAARCLTAAEVVSFAERIFADAGLELRAATGPKPAGTHIGDMATARYERGCAVVAGVQPGSGPREVVVKVWEKGL